MGCQDARSAPFTAADGTRTRLPQLVCGVHAALPVVPRDGQCARSAISLNRTRVCHRSLCQYAPVADLVPERVTGRASRTGAAIAASLYTALPRQPPDSLSGQRRMARCHREWSCPMRNRQQVGFRANKTAASRAMLIPRSQARAKTSSPRPSRAVRSDASCWGTSDGESGAPTATLSASAAAYRVLARSNLSSAPATRPMP